jgi:glycosyltransferase involved in cell wall biosynthesis
MTTVLWRVLVRCAMRVYAWLLGGLTRFGPATRRPAGPQHVVLTGTFHSDNWIRAHLGPLAAARSVGRITMVATTPLPELDKVVAIYPPRWLRRSIGEIPARLLTFAIVALRTRPDVVGGFHLLVNGLAAAVVARMSGAQAWYFCVGGITELRDGGVWGENRYFARLRTPHPAIERELLRAVSSFDLVVTMGRGAVEDFRRYGVAGPRFAVVPGGVADYGPPDHDRPRQFDLILVARLVHIKRIELLIDTIAALQPTRPGISAAIVGDGPLRGELASYAQRRGVAGAVTFAGHQDDVRPWLRRARVFVLVSRSEGLALSMMEAMMEGLPVVVSNVGDLGDLVENGRNGYLVNDPTPEAFAARVADVLRDDRQYRELAANARASAVTLAGAPAATAKWDALLPPGHADEPRGAARIV